MKLGPPPPPPDYNVLTVVLRLGKELEKEYRLARCGFATAAEIETVAGWENRFASEPDSQARDAGEFAALASKRWRYYRQQGAVIDDLATLKQMVAEDQAVEIAMMAVVRADWFEDGGIMGVCHFRRTWANNLFVDFLTNHPTIAAKTQAVSGVGAALLEFLVQVAEQMDASAIWGEATKSSAGFYQTMFKKRVTDEFRFVRRRYLDFILEKRSRDLQRVLDENAKLLKVLGK